MQGNYKVTTICGSMRYFERMMQTAHDLTEQGWIVLMPLVHVIGPEAQDASPIKAMLDDMHFAKIDMSDAIHVVGTYRGKSTTREIEYAQEMGKEVIEVVTP